MPAFLLSAWLLSIKPEIITIKADAALCLSGMASGDARSYPTPVGRSK